MNIDEENKLSVELLKRVFGDLGFVPGFKASGLNKTNEIIKLTEDGKEIEKNIFAGQLADHNTSVAVCDFDYSDSKNLVGIVNTEGQISGCILEWTVENEGSGQFLFWADDCWAPSPIHSQLGIAYLIELITQEGMVWDKPLSLETVLPRLKELIEMS